MTLECCGPMGNREIKITKPDKKFKICVFVMTLTYKMYKNGTLQFGFDVKTGIIAF
jgi:hypothetical protein